LLHSSTQSREIDEKRKEEIIEKTMTPYTDDQRLDALISIAQNACDNAAKHYDDYYKSFAALDGKAQSTATVSGVVLAAVVAFMNAGRLSPLLSTKGDCGYVLVLSPAIGALLAVVVSFAASKVMDITVPFAAADQIKEAEDLARLPPNELSREHILGYQHARLSHWKDALSDIDSGVRKKARLVLWAQVLLVLTLFSLLTLFIALVR
jgi:hypothetical protein